MTHFKFYTRMTAICWLLFDALRIFGASWDRSFLLILPIWLMLMTLYDDAETKRCTQSRQYAVEGGNYARR